MNSDIQETIRNSSFDRNALNRQADQTGAGRVAVEKDFVISIILTLIAGLPELSTYWVLWATPCRKRPAQLRAAHGVHHVHYNEHF